MNEYHVVFYFSDKINFETYIDSQLDIKEFTDEMSENFNAKDNIFVNFVGDDNKYCINKGIMYCFIQLN